VIQAQLYIYQDLDEEEVRDKRKWISC